MGIKIVFFKKQIYLYKKNLINFLYYEHNND